MQKQRDDSADPLCDEQLLGFQGKQLSNDMSQNIQRNTPLANTDDPYQNSNAILSDAKMTEYKSPTKSQRKIFVEDEGSRQIDNGEDKSLKFTNGTGTGDETVRRLQPGNLNEMSGSVGNAIPSAV